MADDHRIELELREAMRRVCEELPRGRQRDPIWYHEAFGKRGKATEDADDGQIARGCRLLAAIARQTLRRRRCGLQGNPCTIEPFRPGHPLPIPTLTSARTSPRRVCRLSGPGRWPPLPN